MSAAFRVGSVHAALQGFLAGCLRLTCGTTGGRNCLANLARTTALTVVRRNLLEFSISFDRSRRSARRFHVPAGRACPGLVVSSAFFLTARVVKCRANTRQRAVQSAHFRQLGNCWEFTCCFMAGNWFRSERQRSYEEIGPSSTPGNNRTRKCILPIALPAQA